MAGFRTLLREGWTRPARAICLASLAAALSLGVFGSDVDAAATGADFTLGGWQIVEFIQPQPACTGVGYEKTVFSRPDCGFGRVFLTPAAAGKAVRIQFVDNDGTVVNTQNVTTTATGQAQFNITPNTNWDPGEISVRAAVTTPGDTGSAETRFTLNPLEVSLAATKSTFAPGEAVSMTGIVNEFDLLTCCVDQREPVPATVQATLHAPDGSQLAGPVSATANSNGQFTITFPSSATAGLTAGADTDFELQLGVQATATYNDPKPFVGADGMPKTSGRWAGNGAGAAVLRSPPDSLLVENSFVSSVGWVKPGQAYPFRVFVKNLTPSAASNAAVTIPAPDGVTFTGATPLAGAGTASTGDGSAVSWTIPTVAAGATATLVVQAQADTLAADPRIVWKDLSSTATLTYAGYAGPALTSESHGPKVIPPNGGFETARYGDKPFPIVPVDYRDRTHEERHNGDALTRKVNSPNVEGSTYNLYQEMSLGQLHPFGAVPSTGIATADFDYGPGFDFSERDVRKPACRGATVGQLDAVWGSPLYPERIRDGWYQLPGDTEYYGGDHPAFTATPLGIDAACGSTSKSVYDAAVIADPEIDYNEFDSDKDGVVDFFMMVFVGAGGNGASQLGVPPYDNIWPHSSNLEASYEDPVTGLGGYTTDDQLTDLEGTPQCWKSTSYQEFDDCAANGGTGQDNLPTHVRVGPYNVNPETAIDQASVISHEYGHHLGLPDYYGSSFSAYNTWNLMAADYSQHMTIFSKQELGWVVPRFLQPGEDLNVTDWEEIKNDTGEIQWRTPDGTPYTLSAANGDQNVHNAESYALKLPRRLLIDPEKVATQASAPFLWHSGRGDNFGCAPEAGHNLDILLPELEFVPAGTPITLTFKSSWDIEWDFDYGFVLTTTDGANYTSLPSAKGYTTPNTVNPQDIACFNRHNNGLTGTSGAAAGGPAQVALDRANGSYESGSPFVTDEYDLSSLAGQRNAVVRFSYFTDGGLARPGWFMDDIVVRVGSEVIYSSDVSQEEPLRWFPGGCGDEGLKVAQKCTSGWSRIKSDEDSDLDHAYYLELRDRSGFDLDGRGQADRGAIGWAPGVLVEYTDEVRGYGNTGLGPPPRQHYLDSQPQPDFDCGANLTEEHPQPAVNTPPRCEDAAFTTAGGDSHFDDVDWIDNFWDDSSEDGLWHFDYGCLTLDVTSMAGHTENTKALPSDLTANARIQAASGCEPFTYGAPEPDNDPPTAAITTQPPDARITEGEEVAFDGSGSTDDTTPAAELTYEWDFEDDGIYDAAGQTATRRYDVAGTYRARLRVTDAEGASDTETVTVTVGSFCQTTTFTDDLEPTAEAGWQRQTAANAVPSSQTWSEATDAGAQSASHSWFSDALTVDVKDDRLLLPPQSLSATSRLSFWHRFYFEPGFDGGVLEVSTDGGGTWHDVLDRGGRFVEGAYNGTISSDFDSAIAGRRAWSAGSPDAVFAPMTKVTVDVGALAGEGVRFRLRLVADPFGPGALPGAGWWVDDVEVTGIPLPCNRPPVANDDAASTEEETAVTIDVVANDSDPEGQPLDVTAVTQPPNGSVVLNADNSVTYTPDASFVSPPADVFSYTVSDGENEVSADVSVTVNPHPNGPPVAADNSAQTQQNKPVTIAVLANDTDPDGDPLTVQSTTQPGHGSAGINADNTVTYTPNTGFIGTDTFDYTVEDDDGATDTATVTVEVIAPPNQSPDAVNDAASTQKNTAVTVNVVSNDTDPDGDALSVSSVGQPAHGNASNSGGGTITYEPDENFVGTDSFSYTISDGRGGTDTATVTVTVADAANRSPVARNDAATTQQGKSVRVSVLRNDTDPDGDALTVTRAEDPPHGSVRIDRGRTITYTPDAGFFGTDTFTYEISDGKGGTSTAEVTITVKKKASGGDDDDDDDGGDDDDD
jgi:immune inhibitor A